MAVTAAQTTDVAQVLGDLLAAVEGVRVYTYVADTTRPPAGGGAIIIGLPVLDFLDETAGFCWARWEFPITIATTRANDRDAQAHLSRLVRDVADALDGPAPAGVFSVEPMDARPGTAALAGQELPSYQMRVQVRA